MSRCHHQRRWSTGTRGGRDCERVGREGHGRSGWVGRTPREYLMVGVWYHASQNSSTVSQVNSRSMESAQRTSYCLSRSRSSIIVQLTATTPQSTTTQHGPQWRESAATQEWWTLAGDSLSADPGIGARTPPRNARHGHHCSSPRGMARPFTRHGVDSHCSGSNHEQS